MIDIGSLVIGIIIGLLLGIAGTIVLINLMMQSDEKRTRN